MEAMTRRLFVPERPTLAPAMLAGARREALPPPFDAPAVAWFYLARNAVRLAADVLELGGTEVLMPSYHHGVELEALAAGGAVPAFYPVGPGCAVDPDDVRRRITPRTRALYLIHYLGFPGPARELRALADERGLALIEDCALALLSRDGASPLGALGDASVYCLHKTLPTPDGGALVAAPDLLAGAPEPRRPGAASTASRAINSLLERLELRGGAPGRCVRAGVLAAGRAVARAGRLERVPVGTMHFDASRADLGISPLSLAVARSLDLAAVAEARRRNYARLLQRLGELSEPLFGALPPGACPLFYPLVVDDKAEALRRLRAAGVEAGDFWGTHHPACGPSDFPDAARLRRTVLELPCHQDLGPETLERLADAAESALKRPAPRGPLRGGRLALGVVGDAAGFAALRHDWGALLEDSGAGVFNSWGWLYPWYRRLAPGLTPFVATARDGDGRLVGVLPLGVERRWVAGRPVRRLGFLGDRAVGSDYLDAVAARGREEEVLRAFGGLLFQRRDEWDILDLTDLDADSPTAGLLRAAAASEGLASRTAERYGCPFERFEPGEGFESFLERTRRRENYLRRRRWLERRPDFRVSAASSPAELPEPLSEFFRLHAARWNGSRDCGGFAAPAVQAFHRDATRLLAEGGKLRLYTLRLGARAAAAVYGLVHGGRFYFYQSAYDPAWKDRSVGLVLLGAVFEDALRLGAREFDFLRGDEAYKSDWASLKRSTVRVRVFAPGGPGAWAAAAEDASRRALRSLKSLLPEGVVEAVRRLR